MVKQNPQLQAHADLMDMILDDGVYAADLACIMQDVSRSKSVCSTICCLGH